MLEYATLTRSAVAGQLDAVARLRISIFQDYPYLYAGSLAYENEYLSKLAQSEKGVIVTARIGEMIVGAATGMPLDDEHDALKQCFRDRAMATDDIYYFAESLLLPRYRRQGAGHKFFDMREAWARELGYKKAVFCTVVRPDDHPARPRNYKPLDQFWTKRGYSVMAGYVAQFPWKEIGGHVESTKPMQFWIGDL